MANLITGLKQEAIPKRHLDRETCRKWDYGTGPYNGEPVQVAAYKTPTGELVAQKVRFRDKRFIILGDISRAGLYGQHLWGNKGKLVVITEGEIDAMSVSQVNGLKWPVVSIPNGAQSAKKAIAAQLSWLEGFESVVLMFDQDEPGIKAAKECAELFSPGKAKIANLPEKDPNELLKLGKAEAIINAQWQAKPYQPDGIVAGTEIWDRMNAVPNQNHTPYPWEGLNKLVLGARAGELILVAAGSGVGKSEVVAQIAYDFLTEKGETVGYLALEEQVEHTAWRLVGLSAGKRLTIDRSGIADGELKQHYDRTVGSGKVFLYDHFGSTSTENIFARIRYMAKALGCTTIILDHISIIVSGMEDGDERRIIDNLMTKLATIVQELKVKILLISHLRKADGTPHEEGGRVSLDDLRGSASLKQLSFDIIGLERNQQDESKKNLTHVRVLKCRRTGQTGSACWLKYDTETGRLQEVTDLDDAFEEEDKNGDF